MIGQPVAIHAAKKIDRAAAELAQSLCYGQHKDGGYALADKLDASFDNAPDSMMGLFGRAAMPIGCVVAIARLEAAFLLGNPAEEAPVPAARIVQRLTARPLLEYCVVPYDDFGDYAPGRWAWLLHNIKALNPPIAVKGARGFFDLPQGWLAQ